MCLQGLKAGWLIAAAALWAAPIAAQQAAAPTLPKATAQTGPLLVSADMRQGTDLSGAWHYSIDPYRSGLAGFHGETPDKGQQRYRDVDVRKEMAQDSRVLYEFDLAHSPVTTPALVLADRSARASLLSRADVVSAHLPGAGAAQGRSFLRFAAANYTTVIYLNGQPVGRHEGGFTPFAFEVTRLLRDGNNQIAVGVDSQATEATVPPPVTDWENYGGITRPVRLISTPDTYVDDAWVRLTRRADGRRRASRRAAGGQSRRPAAHRRTGPRPGRHHTDARGQLARDHGSAARVVRWSPRAPQTL